jgi:hypothetical protein
MVVQTTISYVSLNSIRGSFGSPYFYFLTYEGITLMAMVLNDAMYAIYCVLRKEGKLSIAEIHERIDLVFGKWSRTFISRKVNDGFYCWLFHYTWRNGRTKEVSLNPNLDHAQVVPDINDVSIEALVYAGNLEALKAKQRALYTELKSIAMKDDYALLDDDGKALRRIRKKRITWEIELCRSGVGYLTRQTKKEKKL